MRVGCAESDCRTCQNPIGNNAITVPCAGMIAIMFSTGRFITPFLDRRRPHRSFQSYSNLVDGCKQVGIDVGGLERWDRSISDVFELRSQLVHHAGKDKDGKVTIIDIDRVSKAFTTIKTVKNEIQNSVEVLDRLFLQA